MTTRSINKKVLCAASLLLVASACLAQATVTVAGVKILVAKFAPDTLVKDSLFFLEDSLLKRYQYIWPIEKSSRVFEARCMYMFPGMTPSFRMIVLQGDKYGLQVREFEARRAGFIGPSLHPIKLSDGVYQAIVVREYGVSKPDSIMKRLIDAGIFFNLHDKDKNHIVKETQNSTGDKIILQVKLNNKYRAMLFRVDASSRSEKVMADGDGKVLVGLFNDLVRKSLLLRLGAKY